MLSVAVSLVVLVILVSQLHVVVVSLWSCVLVAVAPLKVTTWGCELQRSVKFDAPGGGAELGLMENALKKLP